METQEQKEIKQQEYEKYVKSVTPTHSLPLQMLKAFVVGGIICVLGQFILNMATNNFGLDKQDAGSWCSLILILISVLLTLTLCAGNTTVLAAGEGGGPGQGISGRLPDPGL